MQLWFSGKNLLLFGGVVVFAVVAAVLTFGLYAQTPAVAFEAEGGALANGAVQVADSAASGGNALKFSANTGYVTVCGTNLCLNGTTWYMYGASVYQGLDNPSSTISQAQTAKLNMVRITDFLDIPSGVAGSTDEARWRKVDGMIAAASQANLKVLLDLSAFRNTLEKNGTNPYTYNWQSFLNFAMTRVNTVSGRTYKDDPAIVAVALAGEVEAPNGGSNPLGVTQQQVTDFFSRTLAQLAATGTKSLRTTGGLMQLSWNSGIDWRTIMSDPNNQICNMHDYSQGDQDYTPTVANYCAGIGKPWITEEFGIRQNEGDSTRASRFQTMYNLQKTNHAAGVAFWNLGTEVVGVNGKTETYDVNPNTPLTLQVVQQNAP